MFRSAPKDWNKRPKGSPPRRHWWKQEHFVAFWILHLSSALAHDTLPLSFSLPTVPSCYLFREFMCQALLLKNVQWGIWTPPPSPATQQNNPNHCYQSCQIKATPLQIQHNQYQIITTTNLHDVRKCPGRWGKQMLACCWNGIEVGTRRVFLWRVFHRRGTNKPKIPVSFLLSGGGDSQMMTTEFGVKVNIVTFGKEKI